MRPHIILVANTIIVTYSIAFSALISATAGEADFWDPGKPLLGVVVFFVVPLFLIIFNSFGVEVSHQSLSISLRILFPANAAAQIYGFTELVGGFTKLTFAFIIIVCMIAINLGGE